MGVPTKFPVKLGQYTLVRLISRGGMANVYEGKRESIAGVTARVAIKMILPEKAKDRTYKELFINEAKVSSNLMHRNLVHIQDFDEIDGFFFLVMEYVEGATLRDTIRISAKRKRKIPFHVVSEIGRQICEGLHHAHQATTQDGKPLQLVHCDIKPGNVILNSQGIIKLLDFGVSHAVTSKSSIRATRGTWGYMSPEQVQKEEVNPRTDLFAVGILLYEMLALRPMFSKAEISNPKKMKELLASDEAVKRVQSLPNDYNRLKPIMIRALQRDSSARYASAEEMAIQLGRLVPDPVIAVGDLTSLLGWIVAVKNEASYRTSISPKEDNDFSGISVQKNPLPPLKEEETGRRKIAFIFLLLFPLFLAGGLYGISRLASCSSCANNIAENNIDNTTIENSQPVKEPSQEPEPSNEIKIIEETKSTGNFEDLPQQTQPKPKKKVAPKRVVKKTPVVTPEPEPEMVRIEPEKEEKVEPVVKKVEPAGVGIITIASDKKATVFIDGRKIKTAPVFKYKISAGEHRIHLARDNGEIKKFSVNIQAGDTLLYQWSFEEGRWMRSGK